METLTTQQRRMIENGFNLQDAKDCKCPGCRWFIDEFERASWRKFSDRGKEERGNADAFVYPRYYINWTMWKNRITYSMRLGKFEPMLIHMTGLLIWCSSLATPSEMNRCLGSFCNDEFSNMFRYPEDIKSFWITTKQFDPDTPELYS